MLAVLDSSCAIALAEANLLPQLSLLFSEVLLPRAVRKELEFLPERRPHLNSLHAGGFVTYCTEYDHGSAETMLSAERRRRLKDLGEAEAIVQASQYRATVLVDDRWARNLVERRGLPCMGSLGIVTRLYDARLLDASSARAALNQMVSAGCRLPLPLVNEFLCRIDQEPLA